MSKLENIKTMLKNILMAFERISTDKALIEFQEEEIAVGVSVWGINEEGERYDLEDGEYKTDEGVIYVIADGKVSEIIEPEVIEEPVAEEPVEEPAVEEVAAEDAQESEEVAEEEPQADPKDERIANLEAEVARLEEELGAARERIAELEKENEDLKNKPLAPSAEEEFEQITRVEKTGDKGLDNLRRYFK